jgi:zinc/manganese transport system substrate-binding protein
MKPLFSVGLHLRAYIMKKNVLNLILCAILLTACQTTSPAGQESDKTIVVTYSVLGSVVKELVGTDANVVILIPNGQDLHDWEPSARDIETLNKADLVIENGLNLEAGLQKTLDLAKQQGVKTFIASDYITVRKVRQGEGIQNGEPDQMVGAADPHLWTDPLTMKQVVIALAEQLKSDLGLDETIKAQNLENHLDALNSEIAAQVSTLPEANRKLVTGHESLGYFADRYGFQLIGAIIPSLSSQAEVSAADLAALKAQIEENHVKAIFTELGTPPTIAQAIGQETGVKVVQLSTHILPSDGSYFTFMGELAQTIVENLR